MRATDSTFTRDSQHALYILDLRAATVPSADQDPCRHCMVPEADGESGVYPNVDALSNLDRVLLRHTSRCRKPCTLYSATSVCGRRIRPNWLLRAVAKVLCVRRCTPRWKANVSRVSRYAYERRGWVKGVPSTTAMLSTALSTFCTTSSMSHGKNTSLTSFESGS